MSNTAGLLTIAHGVRLLQGLLVFVGAAPCARWRALVVCSHRARGAAPAGSVWYLWEQRPARDGWRWWSARIAHGVRLLQGVFGVCGSSALRAMSVAHKQGHQRIGADLTAPVAVDGGVERGAFRQGVARIEKFAGTKDA